jgi:hypothetical protein
VNGLDPAKKDEILPKIVADALGVTGWAAMQIQVLPVCITQCCQEPGPTTDAHHQSPTSVDQHIVRVKGFVSFDPYDVLATSIEVGVVHD